MNKTICDICEGEYMVNYIHTLKNTLTLKENKYDVCKSCSIEVECAVQKIIDNNKNKITPNHE